MTSVSTLVAISALAVLGLYFLWNMLGELIFGHSGKVIGVVPVTSADAPLEAILDMLRISGVGNIIIVDYSGEMKAPQREKTQSFRTMLAAPEHLREALGEINAGR